MENYQGVTKYKRIKDSFGRVHNYLRLSLTDRCNLQCSYCMPSTPEFVSSKKLLSADELETLVSLFTDMGVSKIRLTGGEPLVRKDFSEIAERITQFKTSLHITTNGYHIDRYIDVITKSFDSINISLDTLSSDRFEAISHKNYFNKIWDNIQLALSKNIPTKLNVVVVRGSNHDEINRFAELTLKFPLDIRFIEYMPFRGNDWSISQTYTSQEMLRDIQRKYKVEFVGRSENETAEKFKLKNSKGSFGFISTVSHPFCKQCNRIRITADGKLKNCLFGSEEYDLVPFLNDPFSLKNEIIKAFYHKQFAHGGNRFLNGSCLEHKQSDNRCMTAIGG